MEAWTHYNEWGLIVHNAVLKCGQRELDLVKRYATHDYDSVLELYYAKAQFYDAHDRRFTAVDTILDPSGYDLREYVRDPVQLVQYLYVQNRPLTHIDPLGEATAVIGTVVVYGKEIFVVALATWLTLYMEIKLQFVRAVHETRLVIWDLRHCKFRKANPDKLKYGTGSENMDQYWKVWEPHCEFPLAKEYFINSIVDNPDGMYMFLSGADMESHITIQFPGRVLSYRTSVDLACLRSRMAFVDEKKQTIMEYVPFFFVENSAYAKSIEWDSQGIYKCEQMVHFVLDSSDGIFEVITELAPKICNGWAFETEKQTWGPFSETC